MTDYESFIARKLINVPATGIACERVDHPALFEFQRDLVTWALRRGRCALFADTGLGKTRMQLVWAERVQRETGGRVLILAPLSVARQTAGEGEKIGVAVKRVSYGGECGEPGVYVTNYDKLHKFPYIDPPDYCEDRCGDCTQCDTSTELNDFAAIVLDESSIIKHHDAKTLAILLERFASTRYKLCASATPSPNDYTELGTHAEFLGVCTREEMLAEFFCHDGGDTSKWRLKGHARTAFWRWVSSWAALLRKPSDLGYDDAGYDLPPLRTFESVSPADPEQTKQSGLLFAEPASTLTERRAARKGSMGDRVARCVDVVRAEPDQQWVVWCELNAEQDALRKALGDECVSISGAQDSLTKELLYEQWQRGEKRILLSKVSIFGFGINMQFAARMAFVGISESFEKYYQAVRREWRFGQQREVHVHVFSSELEGNVLADLKRKQVDAAKMADELSAETREMVRAEVRGAVRSVNPYVTRRLEMPEWLTRREADLEVDDA